MTRLCTLSVALLYLTAASTLAAAANPLERIHHVPEPQSSEPSGAWHTQLLWLAIGSVVALVIFKIGDGGWRRLHDYLKDRKWRTHATWRPTGQWVDPEHNASLFVSRAPRKRWPLTLQAEGYSLLIETVDPDKATLAGKLICSTVGHPVGTWTMTPSPESPNRFTLHLIFTDRNDVLLTLRHAG